MHKLFILLCLLVSLPVFSAITVVTENLPQLQYQDENGELVGTVVDKVLTSLKQSNINYEISVNPWSVSYNAALRDENTCIFSIARLPARERDFIWLSKLGRFSASFYSFNFQQISISNLQQAKQYRIAVLKDNYSHIFLKEHGFDETNQLILLDSFDNIYDVLKSRRTSIDLVVLSDQQFNFELQKDSSLNSLKPVFSIPVVNPDLYFACNKNMNTAWLEKLSKAFADYD